MTATDRAPDAPLDQVEWRVQGKIDRGGGVTVVAYLDGPTVSGLLDEWVGPFRWKDHYEPAGKAGTMWCHLSVQDEDGNWITKEDLGTASDMEADKGLVSDAFKRVAMRKWRVGANVFDLPILRITRFRQVERQGKEPQAYLTGESHEEIKQQLTRLGFDQAAQATRVATAEPPPEEPARHSEPAEHPATTVRERIKAAGLADAFVAYLADHWGVNKLDQLEHEDLLRVLAVTGSPEGVETIRDYAPAEVAG